MPQNSLITGPPRSGKTTVVEGTLSRLSERGLTPGGVVSPELRAGGERVGFEIVDVMTGKSRVLAHVDRECGPSVGKYRVNVPAVDTVCEAAFPRAFEGADFLVVDEIAPMEVYSDAFVRYVRAALDRNLPVVAAVHYHSTEGFIGEVKERDDAATFEVDEETREALPEIVAEQVFTARP